MDATEPLDTHLSFDTLAPRATRRYPGTTEHRIPAAPSSPRSGRIEGRGLVTNSSQLLSAGRCNSSSMMALNRSAGWAPLSLRPLMTKAGVPVTPIT